MKPIRTNRTHRTHRRKHNRPLTAAAALTLAAGALVAAPSAHAASATAIEVYPGTSYQTIQGWGTSLAWWAEGTGGWSSTTDKQALADALFSPTDGLGLNIVRYNIGATTPTDTCAAQMRVGGAVPSFEQSSGSYDWTQDPNQMWMLRAAQSLGANVFQGIAYSAPAWMTENDCSAGATTAGADNLASSEYGPYAQYLATVAQHFDQNFGIPLSTIEPFNEPVQTSWSSTTDQQGMNLGTSARNAILPDLKADLAADGIGAETAISASDEYSIAGSVSDLKAYSSAALATISQINTHGYSGGDGDPLYEQGVRDNLPVEMSEWGDATQSSEMAAGLDLSQQILTNEQQLHPSSWVSWQGADGPDNGGNIDDLWGLVWTDISSGGNGTLTFPSRYYVMGNYSKFIRPGYRMIQNTDPNTFTAYDPGTQSLVIVATNPNASSESLNYDLSGFTSTGSQASAYQTDATENLATLSPAAVSGGSLAVTLPADSVTTYVLPDTTYTGANSQVQVDDADTGTGADQWAYTGSGWQHCSGSACGDPQDLYDGTTSWDATTGDSATLTFTGTQVNLYGVLDDNEGIGSVQIDGGSPTNIDFYSPVREGDQLVYQSPQLATGTHTLRLTVTGTKNPLSSGDFPAIDRAEVTTGPSPATGSLVTSRVTGTLRSNLTGQVGMSFTTGSSGLTVAELGREYATGDTGTHTVALYQASTGAEVASTQVNTATAPIDGLGFQYGDLGSPITLAPNTTYYLVTSETNGGDPWFDADSTATVGDAVTGVEPVWSSNGTTWTTYADPGQLYGPVNLLS